MQSCPRILWKNGFPTRAPKTASDWLSSRSQRPAKQRRWCAARAVVEAVVVALAIVTSPVVVHAKTLQWHLASGGEYRFVVERTVRQKSRVTDWTETIRYQLRWTVESVDEEGRMRVSQKLTEVRHSLQFPDAEPVIYDSTLDAEFRGDAASLARIWKPRLNVEQLIVVQPNGEVLSPAAEASQERPPATAAPATASPENSDRSYAPPALHEGLLSLPSGDLSLNQRWVETKLLPWLDRPDALKLTVSYTYQGEELVEQQSYDRIQCTLRWEAQPAADGSLPVLIERHSGSGIIYFDSAAGHLARVELAENLTVRLPREENRSEVIDLSIGQKVRCQPVIATAEAGAAVTP